MNDCDYNIGDKVPGLGILKGKFICPSDDGDYTCAVYDMHTWAENHYLIRQEGQCERNDIVLERHEAFKLGKILKGL